MTPSLAALEFDRVLALVASFARTERGRRRLLDDPPRFQAAAGLRSYRLTAEITTFISGRGSLAFDGLDAAELLATATDLEVHDLTALVTLVRRIVETRQALPGGESGELAAIVRALPHFESLLATCDRCLGPGGEVLDSASPTLAQARATRERSRGRILSALESMRRAGAAGSGPFTMRRERYCVPVPAGERSSLPGLVLDSSGSGATLFVEPFEIVELNNAMIEATATAREEEERVIREVAARIGRERDALLAAADRLAELDAYQARALFGQRSGGALVEPGAGDRIHLIGARHPLLDPGLADLREDALGAAGNRKPIVPLDLDFPPDGRLLLLSGPNAGGKTVALKTVGLAIAMVQAGIPVLAEPGSAVPAVSALWCHVGDEQNLLSDLSTFTGAMQATARLLAEADENTLVLYDEVGAGTDPEEGAALAAALLEELARRRCWTIATGHLVTVAAHIEQLPGAVNASMGFDESCGAPTFALRVGLPGRSRGLEIARRTGVPQNVLERATGMLSRGFLTIDTYLERLQAERERLEEERSVLRLREREAAEARDRRNAAVRHLEDERERLRASLGEERDRLRRKAKERLDDALAELRAARERGELPGRRRIAAIRTAALQVDDQAEPTAPTQVTDLEPGQTVRLRGASTTATLARVDGDRVELIAGTARIWMDRSECEPVDQPKQPGRTAVTILGDESATSELNVIGLSREDARESVEAFLDRALRAGVHNVRIVHGHGSGALRRMVRELLAKHPAVVSYAHPPQARGGTGATEVELE